ncbi:hypothetical protein GMES_0072 [Paraglaciecola mesophila KMM 241]|uniref:Uncharacterized protein n=1 Tax=Paraglaciecola mesophila KMM 241 TaxID=1128912 RepID=K6YW45_9ALTE|nr:hypothetical protein GMES_0072 [Paraglaciecola mesophila KMM 241]
MGHVLLILSGIGEVMNIIITASSLIITATYVSNNGWL